jgi:hypothetical protein
MRFTIYESKGEGAVADRRRLQVAGAGVRAGRATKLNEEGRMQNEEMRGDKKSRTRTRMIPCFPQ